MTALMPGAGPPPTRIASVFTMPSAQPSYAKRRKPANKRPIRICLDRAHRRLPTWWAARSAARLDDVAHGLAHAERSGDRQRDLEQELEDPTAQAGVDERAGHLSAAPVVIVEQ